MKLSVFEGFLIKEKQELGFEFLNKIATLLSTKMIWIYKLLWSITTYI